MCRILAAALCLAFAAPALAADSQQERAASCNARAAALKEGERKEFLAACLRGQGRRTGAAGAQELRAKDCNRKAAGLQGDEKQQFLRDCLAAKPR
jgi:hypothetical protein